MLSHAIAVGAGCFRFTVAFSLGPRSFSSLNLTIHPSETISRFYLGAEGKRSGHRFSSQPVDRFSRALRRGDAPGPSSRSYLARRMSLGEVAFLDWAVSFGVISEVYRHPWFFRFTGEGRIPSGNYPSSLATALASFHGGERRIFLVHEVVLR